MKYDPKSLEGLLYPAYQPVRVLKPCGDGPFPVRFLEALARATDAKGVPIKIGDILEAFQDDAGKRVLAFNMIGQALRFLASHRRGNFHVSVNFQT